MIGGITLWSRKASKDNRLMPNQITLGSTDAMLQQPTSKHGKYQLQMDKGVIIVAGPFVWPDWGMCQRKIWVCRQPTCSSCQSIPHIRSRFLIGHRTCKGAWSCHTQPHFHRRGREENLEHEAQDYEGINQRHAWRLLWRAQIALIIRLLQTCMTSFFKHSPYQHRYHHQPPLRPLKLFFAYIRNPAPPAEEMVWSTLPAVRMRDARSLARFAAFPLRQSTITITISAIPVIIAMASMTRVGVRYAFSGHALLTFWVDWCFCRVKVMTAIMTTEKIAVNECWVIR